MTPQKKLEMCLPIVNTPGSPAMIKSILQSARKTGLNSSPIRIPFAMSPMAARLQAAHVSQFQLSPIKSVMAKEPSLPIKEAFLSNEDRVVDYNYILNFETAEGEQEEQMICLPFSNKRSHEDDDEIVDEHEDKRERLEGTEIDETYEGTEIDETNEAKIGEINESDSSAPDNHDEKHDIHSVPNTLPLFDHSVSDDSLFSSTSTHNSNPTAPSASPSFSTDLLINLRDPELASPELTSAPDTRVSRSENQDQRIGGTFTANPLIISKSSSSSSSTGSNPLLPSGIIKLLEKKRQEKEQHHNQSADSPNVTHSTSTTAMKKKFDLKESLKRSLPYKPHIGSMKNPSDHH